MNKLFAILLALAAFGVVLTGCQSGDDDSGNGAPAAGADSDDN